jgi:hypothetical protein
MLIVAIMRLISEQKDGKARLLRLHHLLRQCLWWSNGATTVTSCVGGLNESTSGLKSGHDYISMLLHMLKSLSTDIIEDIETLRTVISLSMDALTIYTIAHGVSTWERVNELETRAAAFIATFQATLGGAAMRQRSARARKAAASAAAAAADESDDDNDDSVELNT